MIYTSYFAQLKKLPDNCIPISICSKAPSWYNGLQYKKLSPTYNLLMKWKNDHDNDYYVKTFQNETLNHLDQYKVLTELQNSLPDSIKQKLNTNIWENKDYHIVLICYEKSTDFCHRHLVSKWINTVNVIVNEYIF